MTLDLSQFEHFNDFDFQSSLGPLRSGTVTVGTHKAIHERFPDIKAANPTTFTRFLIVCIVGRPRDGEKKTEALTEVEVNELTAEDLGNFAKLFIEHNRGWLFEDFGSHPKGPDDKPTPMHGTLEMPQHQGEDIETYLHRLFSAYLRRRAEHNREAMSKWLPKSLSSDSTWKLLEQNRSISKALEENLRSAFKFDAHIVSAEKLAASLRPIDKLNDEMEKLRSANVPFADFAPGQQRGMRIPEPPLMPPNPIHKTNETLAAVVSQLESVSAVSIKSAELLKNMNDLGLSMAKSSAEYAQRTAGQNQKMIAFALLGIIVSTIGIVVSAIFSGITFFQDRDKDAATAALLTQVATQLRSSQQAMFAAQSSADARREALEAQLRDKDAATAALLRQVVTHLDSSQRALNAAQRSAYATRDASEARSKVLQEASEQQKKIGAKPSSR